MIRITRDSHFSSWASYVILIIFRHFPLCVCVSVRLFGDYLHCLWSDLDETFWITYQGVLYPLEKGMLRLHWPEPRTKCFREESHLSYNFDWIGLSLYYFIGIKHYCFIGFNTQGFQFNTSSALILTLRGTSLYFQYGFNTHFNTHFTSLQ